MKKLIACLLVFTVLAVGVTYGCIQHTLRSSAEEPLPIEAGIDLNGFYDENDLLVTEVREVIQRSEWEDAAVYPQIDGLKNADVQDAVNERIRTEAERLKGCYGEYGTELQYLSYTIHGSFANVLSVGLFSGDDDGHYEQVHLTFNLNDGSLLELEDLFAAGADLPFIVHSAFYDALTRSNLYQTYGQENNYPDEQLLYKTVKAYLNGERDFALSPSEIYLYYGDYTASVPMTEFADDITVYNKYLSAESLFAEDGIGCDGMFTCAEVPRYHQRRELGFAADNFWYDISMPEVYFSDTIPTEVRRQCLRFADELYESLLDEAEALRQQAEARPDRAYVLLAEPRPTLYCASEQIDNAWRDIPSRAMEVNWNYRLYEMDAALFADKYRQELVNLYRSSTYTMFYGGLDAVIDSNAVQVTVRNATDLYDYLTGRQLTLGDVFAEGYDYDEVIRRLMQSDLTAYFGYTPEAAEQALQTARFELAGSNVHAYLPEWGTEQYLTMAFSQFSRSALTIFE